MRGISEKRSLLGIKPDLTFDFILLFISIDNEIAAPTAAADGALDGSPTDTLSIFPASALGDGSKNSQISVKFVFFIRFNDKYEQECMRKLL